MFSNPDCITSGQVLRECVCGCVHMHVCICVCVHTRAGYTRVCILAPFPRGAPSLIVRSTPSSWEPLPGAPPKQAYNPSLIQESQHHSLSLHCIPYQSQVLSTSTLTRPGPFFLNAHCHLPIWETRAPYPVEENRDFSGPFPSPRAPTSHTGCLEKTPRVSEPRSQAGRERLLCP